MTLREKKRILVFTTDYMNVMGGSQIALREVMRELSDECVFDVVTSRFSLHNAQLDFLDKVVVHRVGFGFSYDRFLLPLLGLWKGLFLTRKNAYSLVWASQASYGGLAAYFLIQTFSLQSFVSARRLPFLLSIQEDSVDRIERGRFGLIKFFVSRMVKSANHIHVISHYLRQYVERLGVLCPISVVPNGVHIELFSTPYSFEDTQLLKTQLGIRSSDLVIITTSRLVPKNGVEDIIRACALLTSPWKCIIIGTGSREHFLRSIVRDLGVEHHVLFLGHISHQDIPRYLACADVFIRPSLTEGLGNSFLEAMAAGVPVVGTAVGGIVDFLRHRETGLFCVVKNPLDISQKIACLLDDDALKNYMMTNARTLVIREYSWKIIAQKMKDIIQSML